MLNARRRHRLDHRRAAARSPRTWACSTPGGVIVSITCEGWESRPTRPTAQRPEASSSRSPSSPSPCRWTPGAARRPEASSSRSPRPRGRRQRVRHLLNARRRHRLDHTSPIPKHLGAGSAQRPEASSSRSLAWAKGGIPGKSAAQRPEASSSRSPATPWPSPGTSRTAQRPEASSSRSQGVGRVGVGGLGCSTPGGVIVSITPPGRAGVSGRRSAQRPEASSSRSLAGRARHRDGRPKLLNARRRHRLDHARLATMSRPMNDCSTPGGVIVSITRGPT